MPFQNLKAELEAKNAQGKFLSADEKCGRAIQLIRENPEGLTYEDLQQLMQYIEIYAKNDGKLLVAAKNKLTRAQANGYKAHMIDAWLGYPPQDDEHARPAKNRALSYEQFAALLIPNPRNLEDTIKSWIDRCDVSLQMLTTLINGRDGLVFFEPQKEVIFKSWYRNPKNQLSEEQMIELIRGRIINQISTQAKHEIAQLFFEKNNFAPPQSHLLMIYLVDAQTPALHEVRRQVIQNHSFEQLLNAFNENNAFLETAKWNAVKKYQIFADWMALPANKNSLTAARLKFLLELNRELEVKNLLGNENSDLKLAAEFCADKYDDSDHQKVEFFTRFIRDKISRLCSEEMMQILLPLMDSFSNHDQLCVMAREMRDYFRLKPEQISALTKNRTLIQHLALRTLLETKKIEDVVKPGEMQKLHGVFGDAILEMSALEVFAYYNATENAGSREFRNFLKPEFLKEIKETYLISREHLCFLTRSEYSHLRFLVERLELPRVATLADGLKGKIKILSLPQNEIPTFKINFDEGFHEEPIPDELVKTAEDDLHNFKSYTKTQRGDLTQRFKQILFAYVPKPTPERPRPMLKKDLDVLRFFTSLLKKDEGYFNELSEERIKEFCEFVYNNKRKIAYLLSQPDGIDVLANVVFSIKDACSKNITSVFNTALIEYSLRKSTTMAPTELTAVRVLYQLYNDDIFAALVNRKNTNYGEFYVGRSDNPLDHPTVRQSIICPKEFVEKINKKFESPDEIKFLKNILFIPANPSQPEEEQMAEFQEALLEADGFLESTDRIKNLVAHFVLGQGLPALRDEFKTYFDRSSQVQDDIIKIQKAIIDNRLSKVTELLKHPQNNLDITGLSKHMAYYKDASLNAKIEFLETWLLKDKNYLTQQNFDLIFNKNYGFIGDAQFEEGDERAQNGGNPRQYLMVVVQNKNAMRLAEALQNSQKYIEILEAEARGELSGALNQLYPWLDRPENFFTYNELNRLFRPGGVFAHFTSEHKFHVISRCLVKEQNNFSGDQICDLFSNPQFLRIVLNVHKLPLLKVWLNRGQNNFSFEQINFLFSQECGFYLLPAQKYEIILKSLQKRDNNITSEQLLGLLPHLGGLLMDQYSKVSLLLEWLKKDGNNFTREEQYRLLVSGEYFVSGTFEHQQIGAAIAVKNCVPAVLTQAQMPSTFAASALAAASVRVRAEASAPAPAAEAAAARPEIRGGMRVSLGDQGNIVVQDLLKPFKDFVARAETPEAKCDLAIAWFNQDDNNNLTFTQLFNLFIGGGVLSKLDSANKFRLTARWLERGNNNFEGAQLDSLSRMARFEAAQTEILRQRSAERRDAGAAVQDAQAALLVDGRQAGRGQGGDRGNA